MCNTFKEKIFLIVLEFDFLAYTKSRDSKATESQTKKVDCRLKEY